MANGLMRELLRAVERSEVWDDILHEIGLQRRPGMGQALAGVGLFAAGAIVGAAASMLLTPKSGPELREELLTRVQSLRAQVEDQIQSARKSERYNPPS